MTKIKNLFAIAVILAGSTYIMQGFYHHKFCQKYERLISQLNRIEQKQRNIVSLLEDLQINSTLRTNNYKAVEQNYQGKSR